MVYVHSDIGVILIDLRKTELKYIEIYYNSRPIPRNNNKTTAISVKFVQLDSIKYSIYFVTDSKYLCDHISLTFTNHSVVSRGLIASFTTWVLCGNHPDVKIF